MLEKYANKKIRKIEQAAEPGWLFPMVVGDHANPCSPDFHKIPFFGYFPILGLCAYLEIFFNALYSPIFVDIWGSHLAK